MHITQFLRVIPYPPLAPLASYVFSNLVFYSNIIYTAVCEKKNESKITQKLVESGPKIRQKLVESEAEIRQFESYNVLIIQDMRYRNLKYFNEII